MAETTNLAVLGEEALQRLGDHESLVFEGTVHRSGDLAARGRHAGGGLIDIGIAPGDRVVVLMANCPEVFVTYGAIWRAGAVVTPVVFLVTAPELRHILVDSEAVAVVTTTELLGTVLAAVEGVATVRTVVVAGEMAAGTPADAGATPPVLPFASLESAAERPIVDRAGTELAALMYTGGTTGRSKGVALSHAGLTACARSAHSVSYVPGITRGLIPLPVSHAYGMIVTVAGLHGGERGRAGVQRGFNPTEFISLAQEWRVQRAALVPAMLQMLLAEPLEEADLSSLCYVGSGAAPLPLEVLREFERRVPSAQVLEGYGCTESSAVISSNPPARRRAGSVGLPIPGCTVGILDDDDAPLPTGSDGEICVRSPFMMTGYWNAPDETEQTMRGGWLHTGDIGHLDADGYLYVVDRKKDLILRGGFNVYPRDVEDVLTEHPDVAMAGVVGRPDSRLGEEVVAYVSLRAGAAVSTGDLVGFARGRLAATKAPREVHILDQIPLTSVGKLDRKALRAVARAAEPLGDA